MTPTTPASEMILEAKSLNAWFGRFHAVKGVSMAVPKSSCTAMIGPSGCGKSTFLRCLNRLHEEILDARVNGEVLLDGKNIYSGELDAVSVRRRIGMVFQKPNPFPSLSIFENVAVGLRLTGGYSRSEIKDRVEKSLKSAALWKDVESKLKAPGTSLSGGQQQRLCIARALAVNPPVLLMDEPTSALDPISTAKIEELISELKSSVTVLIVTHNMQQASRVSDQTAFFLHGELIEYQDTGTLFTTPKEKKTEDYITGRFG